MSERVWRATHIRNAGSITNSLHNRFHSAFAERLTVSAKKQSLFVRGAGLTIHFDVFPEQFRHLWTNPNLAFLLSLAEHLDMAFPLCIDLTEIINRQPDDFSQPNASISHQSNH